MCRAASAANLTSSDRGPPEGVEEVSSAHPRCEQAIVPDESLPGTVAGVPGTVARTENRSPRRSVALEASNAALPLRHGAGGSYTWMDLRQLFIVRLRLRENSDRTAASSRKLKHDWRHEIDYDCRLCKTRVSNTHLNI